MKKNIPSFLMGVIATVLVFSLSIPVLAAAGLTITVNTDMKVQVNNQVFQPKDVNGNDVMVFEYQGTTYAPLRAIAEAYGLKVGYDPEKRMATVGENNSNIVKPDYSTWTAEQNAAYEEFKKMWTIEEISIKNQIATYSVSYIESESVESAHARFESIGQQTINKYIVRWMFEKYDNYKEQYQILFGVSSYGYLNGFSQISFDDGVICNFNIHINCHCKTTN